MRIQILILGCKGLKSFLAQWAIVQASHPLTKSIDNRWIETHQWHYKSSWLITHGLTDRRPITLWRNWPIRSITRVWYNSLWLGRWLPHRLSKHQLLSQQKSYSELHSPGWSYSTYLWRSWTLSLTYFLCHLALIHELLELGDKENRKSTQGKEF